MYCIKEKEWREMVEKINHPEHYNRPGRKECIEEMLDIYGPEKVIAFCELNAYKYRYRAGFKGSEEEDLKKAKWYLKKMDEIKVGLKCKN